MVLYIGNETQKIQGGADLVNKRNLAFIRSVYGKDNVDVVALPRDISFQDKIRWYLGGLNPNIENEILEKLSKKSYNQVFVSNSSIGRITKKIKKKFGDEIKIISFFHNAEIQYAVEFIKSKGFKKIPFLFATYFNEAKSVKYSDVSIVLNKRDAHLIKKYYNRDVEGIIPVSLPDQFDKNRVFVKNANAAYLFVGSAFFPNVSGVIWFIENVLPYVPGKLTVVGNGMERALNNYRSEKVEVYDYVENLADFYYKESVIVSPIFSGGGMKTKTAEALMYGKTIVGTHEAFEGYVTNKDSMIICETAEQFINELNNITEYGLNIASRNVFEDFYNETVVFSAFKNLITTGG